MSAQRATLTRVLANDRLRRVELSFLAFVAAEFGVWLAVLVYAYQRGGATLTAVIAVVQLIPAAAVAPLAARSIDRRGGGPGLLIGYAILALTLTAMAGLMLLDAASPIVYVGAVVAASAVTLIRPAQSALVPEIVSEPSDLTAANAVSGWVESVSVLIGPALAGVMIGIDGPGAAIAVFAIATGLATIVVAPLGGGLRLGALSSGGEARAGAGSVTRVLGRHTGVSVLLSLVAVEFIALGALDLLEVVLAFHVLGLGSSGAGYLAAAFGAGAVAGAAGTFALVGRSRLADPIIVAAGGAAGAFLALGVWPTVAGAFALLGVVGIGRSVLDVGVRTMLHRIVPTEMRGRVFGIQEGLSMLGLALGSIAVPPLVHAGGAQAALIAVGALLAVVAAVSAPALRALELAAPTPSSELAALRRSPLFSLLEAPVLEDLARALARRDVLAGEVTVREGDPGDTFYLVASGELDVSIGGRHVQTINAGDGFGEIALLRDGIRIATVTARGPSILYALAREPFLDAVTGSYPIHRAAEALVAERVPGRSTAPETGLNHPDATRAGRAAGEATVDGLGLAAHDTTVATHNMTASERPREI